MVNWRECDGLMSEMISAQVLWPGVVTDYLYSCRRNGIMDYYLEPETISLIQSSRTFDYDLYYVLIDTLHIPTEGAIRMCLGG
jgi:hypothetical protein